MMHVRQNFASVTVLEITQGVMYADSRLLFDAFDIGISRAVLALKLKFACWDQLPWKLCGLHGVKYVFVIAFFLLSELELLT
jgi:hypothetical protein